MTAVQGIVRSEGTPEGRGQQRNPIRRRVAARSHDIQMRVVKNHYVFLVLVLLPT